MKAFDGLAFSPFPLMFCVARDAASVGITKHSPPPPLVLGDHGFETCPWIMLFLVGGPCPPGDMTSLTNLDPLQQLLIDPWPGLTVEINVCPGSLSLS